MEEREREKAFLFYFGRAGSTVLRSCTVTPSSVEASQFAEVSSRLRKNDGRTRRISHLTDFLETFDLCDESIDSAC